MELYPYQDSWAEDDPHANFKAEVAQYSQTDPLPTLENLSRATGIPVPCLVRYILVKYAVSGAEALLAMTPSYSDKWSSISEKPRQPAQTRPGWKFIRRCAR